MITKEQYDDILSMSKNYRYTSMQYSEYDEYIKCEIYIMNDTNIILIDNSKNPVHIHWATNSPDKFIEELKKLNNNIFMDFVPKEFVKQLKSIGFNVFCEYMDFFNEDIRNTPITVSSYDSIEFLLPSEIEQASKVSQLCKGQSRGFTGETDAWFEKWLGENKVIVVRKDNNIIGFCCVSIYSNGTILWIREIAVNPDYQRKGYGKKLIEQALCYGIINGAQRGFLAVDVLNEQAIRLYKRYCFIPRSEESEIQMIGE